MTYSRLRRYEERRQERKIVGAIAGIIAIFVFLILFGVKILIGFSVLVGNIRGNKSTQTQTTQKILQPPELDPLPIATNSATIKITGKATAGLTVTLYVNSTDTDKVTVDSDGSFHFDTVKLIDGDNTVNARVADTTGTTSDLSETFTVTSKKSKATLDVTSPADGAHISGDKNIVTVSGKTDESSSVTISGRVAVVRNDGSFSYDYPLPNGDTTLQIVATDIAGNQTTVERKVNYSK